MPRRPASYAQRRRTKAIDDKAYDATIRKMHPQFRAAKHIRSSRRWQKVRMMKLNESPLCEDPFQHHRHRPPPAATQVDHVIPLHENPDLAYHMDNLQSVCHACHAVKSAHERKG